MGNQVCLPEEPLRKCGKTFYSTLYPKNQKTGHNLASWAVYQHVALRLSFEDIALSINDMFGYSLQRQCRTACPESLG